MPPSAGRVLPVTQGPGGFFWTSGADGRLRFLRCETCSYFIHPPVSYCPRCGGRGITPEVVSGCGTVYSFTVNHQSWDGTGDVYIIAVVEMVEQQGLRLVTNIIGIDPEDVRIGMSVEVVFEDHDPVYLPLFRPVAS
ncbi:DNA-binding protein [Mycobacterium sp. 1274761.0]|nr:DNA-binding protein [Mycobacterium sp. 1274761.0]